MDLEDDEVTNSDHEIDDTSQSVDIQEDQFLKEKLAMEAEFGQKRAKFKEIYLQKEGELSKLKSDKQEMEDEIQKLKSDIQNLQKDVDESKSLTAVAEYTKESEIAAERRKCQEELASLHRIMEESITEVKQSAAVSYEKEVNFRKNKKWKAEKLENKPQLNLDKEGVLSAVTKSLKRSVGGLTPANPSNPSDNVENLEDGMRRAQEDAEMLRSLVVPLEEEIHALKDKLRSTDQQLQNYERAKASILDDSDALDLSKNVKSTDVVGKLDEKVHSLSHDLQAEKSSRSDLEMYVAVLNLQKTTLQEENEKIQIEFKEVCKLFEKEKRELEDLKQTWQRANDQFLESQRMQIIEMRRMQSILSEEQQRQLLIQKQEDERKQLQQHLQTVRNRQPSTEVKEHQSSDVDSQQTNVSQKRPLLWSKARSFKKNQQEKKYMNKKLLIVDKNASFDKALSDSDLATVQNSAGMNDISIPATTDLLDHRNSVDSASVNNDGTYGCMRRAYSSSAVSLYKDSDNIDEDDDDESIIPELRSLALNPETRSLHETSLRLSFNTSNRWSPEKLPSLTDAQQRALTESTPESEARRAMVDSVRLALSNTDVLSAPSADKRLVSENEWHLLQQELKKATEKLGRPCDMCSNYETQLQRVQHEFKEKEKQCKTGQQMLERYKKDLKQEQTYRQELEEKFSSLSEQSQKEVNSLYLRLEESEKLFAETKSLYSNCYEEIKSQMKLLIQKHEELQKELIRVNCENESLVGKHSAQAQEMQNEVINLPNNMEDMQLLLLKYREDIIDAKVAKQHAEEKLHSEIMFLRDSVKAEQMAKESIEDQLMQELDSLRENTGIAESIKPELEREKALRIEYEKSLKDSHGQLKQTQEKSKYMITALQKQYEEIMSQKGKFESEVYSLRAKVSSLQTDLENSEAVQRDFVKLSQNLQVQLEKIRQSENEVRWQHEEDVEECSNCKQNFSVTRRKHHCRHCGHIFCADCTSKIVYSGAHNRQSRVCDVCHTLLVRDTAPYFSNEPPQTPD